MQSGFENEKFYVDYQSPGRQIGTFREELELAVKNISNQSGDNLLLSLSSGLDSQIILHSLHLQDLPYKCAFMYMPGYNDHEYDNVKLLENKYGFKSIIIEINPDDIKDEILDQVDRRHIMPNNFIHKKFLSMLPEDLDFLTGIEGPDIVNSKKDSSIKLFQEAYWNYENLRLRILNEVQRTGRILNLDRNENSESLLASILNDSIVKGYVHSMNYILENDLVNKDGKKPYIIFNWNYYLKPIIIGKYWKDELIYFPKSMGIEKIKWIIDHPLQRQPYWEDVVYIDYWKFLKFLLSDQKKTVRFYSNKSSSNPISEFKTNSSPSIEFLKSISKSL